MQMVQGLGRYRGLVKYDAFMLLCSTRSLRIIILHYNLVEVLIVKFTLRNESNSKCIGELTVSYIHNRGQAEKERATREKKRPKGQACKIGWLNKVARSYSLQNWVRVNKGESDTI